MKRIMILLNILLFCLLTSCSKVPTKQQYTIYAMDTIIQISFYDVEESKEIAKKIEEIYLKYDAVASDFDSGKTDISVYDLNLSRSAIVSSELLSLIQFALLAEKDTDGYFNPLIGNLTHLWKEALKENKLLSSQTVEKELEKILQSSLQIEDHHVTILGEANLDLGGIAKGYATQKAREYLDSIGCTSYLINAGASNIVLGTKSGDVFKVGLNKPFDNGYYLYLELKEISLGTSSMKQQHTLIDQVYYSHLLNPKTGWPSQNYDSLTILGSDSALLDAYSTAVFAMNLEMAISFLEEKQLDWVAYQNKEILYQSEGVAKYAQAS